MSRTCLVLLLVAALGSPAPPSRAATMFGQTPSARSLVATPRRDAVVLRLAPAAARAARPTLEGRRTTDPGLESAGARFAALGLAALDRFAGTLGGAWFEREFPAETAPPPGSLEPDFTAFWILHMPPGDPERVAGSLRAVADIADAQPIKCVPVQAAPDDSLWSAAYYLFQPSRRDVHAVEAWEVTTGDTSIVVAIVDTGVLLDHPDLVDQMWTNWAERGGIPGVDDDGNGYIDDDRGWDFVALESVDDAVPGEDARDQDPDPNDFVGHGTAVAGVVGARTNNRIGVAGAAWKVRLMALRTGWSASFNPSGEIDLAYAARAIRYATRMGAGVINCSFASEPQPDLAAATTAAIRAGVTVVTAAGNSGSVHYLGSRADVVSVAATDRNDKIATFSNRGSYVDLAAAGWDFATTALYRPGTDSTGLRQPTYTRAASGTSFSSPLVAGAAALLQAQRRASGLRPLNPMEMLLRLTETTDDISADNPGVTGYGTGRLNIERALTDPPGSIQLDARGAVVGPAVLLPALSGGMRVVLVTADRRFLVLDPASGATVREAALPNEPATGLAAADLGQGRGVGFFFIDVDGRIHGLTGAGLPLPGWPTSPGAWSAHALGDLDGDGAPEIVATAENGDVAAGLFGAWHADGTVAGSSLVTSGGPFALAPLDLRPGLEIVVADGSTTNVGTVRALDDTGALLPGWPVELGEQALDVVVGTLAGTSEPVIVVAGPRSMMGVGADGSVRWRRSMTGIRMDGLALANVAGDETDEVLQTRGLELWALSLDGGTPLPGWPITMAEMAVGPPVAGHLGGTGPGLMVPTVPSGLLAFDSQGNALRGFPKPGRAGRFPALADLDGDGRTEVFAGHGGDTALYVYDVGPSTWSDAPQPWPTDRGNAARTGSTLGAPPLGILDDVPPAPVGDLAATSGDRSIALRWSAPHDESAARAERYELRYSRLPLDEATFASGTLVDLPPPAPGGSDETSSIAPLDETATYHFALRSFDRTGNPSALSNAASAITRSVPPSRAARLSVVAGDDTSVTLRWAASGDDGSIGRPALYKVHAAPTPLDQASFDSAPVRVEHTPAASGDVETARVSGLVARTRYWFAVEAVDAAGNRSGISNLATAWVGPFAARPGLALATVAQPASTPVEILWQWPGAAPGARHTIEIFDLGGRVCRTFRVGPGTEGSAWWDGADDDGRRLRAGVYFTRFESGGQRALGRIVLLR